METAYLCLLFVIFCWSPEQLGRICLVFCPFQPFYASFPPFSAPLSTWGSPGLGKSLCLSYSNHLRALSPGRSVVPKKDCCSRISDHHRIELCFHWAQHGDLGHLDAQLVVGDNIILVEAEVSESLRKSMEDSECPDDTPQLWTLYLSACGNGLS